MIYIDKPYKSTFKDETTVDDFFKIKGEIFRQFKRRYILRFNRNNDHFFIKCHGSLDYMDIMKDLLRFRIPVMGAITEWKAIHRLRNIGIVTPEPVAYGISGNNPLRQRSFIITKDVGKNVSLEKLTASWRNHPPLPSLKWNLIRKVAHIARKIHENGINHRDFYLCHFLIPISSDFNAEARDIVNLILIDLHRVQIRSKTPARWILKDISGLFFSSMEIGLTKFDRFRFMKWYRSKPLRETLYEDKNFWLNVDKKAKKLYVRHNRGKEND